VEKRKGGRGREGTGEEMREGEEGKGKAEMGN